jgi:hypothetical protein
MARTGDMQMKTCVNCGSGNIDTLGIIQEHIDICNNCGYGRPSLRSPIQYDENYEKKYLEYPEEEICNIRLSFIRMAECCLNTKNPFPNRSERTILDYGCGSGAFVRAARLIVGCIAYGEDVNSYTADLRPPVGFMPDIVTAWDSFEHLTDYEQAEFFSSSRNAKIIIVSVPDFSTVLQDGVPIFKWRHYRPQEHLHYYTEKSLRIRLEREGYRFAFSSHEEDKVRMAPWPNNILTVGFIK